VRTTTPRGACDCHVHIYEDRFALAASATFKPPHAPVSAYRLVQRALGLQRAVLVQPTAYGFDNACLLDALAQLDANTIGVAVVPADVSDATLERLHAGGVRGVRCTMLGSAGALLPWDTLEAMAARIAPLGWHIDLQFDGREMGDRKAMIDRLPCSVVIDHIGRFVEPVPVHDAAFKALQAVLDRDRRWVKLSAPYETSKVGPPNYDDVAPLARALAHAHPERCLWASNWPHPNRVSLPSDADLLALLAEWVPDAAARRRILTDNAALAYGF
jgi:D-galactarolactone isomerase